MAIAIQVENLSKQYRLGKIGTGALSHDINRWWYKIRGKEDPYLKIGEVNDRTQSGNSQYVWSLRDINFTIEQGDAVGIIGRNGAGKSTLLKILSRVTAPTTGSIKIKGRVASLLEVGTGFHPELSGRENIFLNGAILGMRKQEVKRKFDEIVAFAGVERYVDTPVKRYSSGMYVRLAFAVAAHLESEILIVDEVLAVGDAEFQRKCLGKMNDVSKGEGRTVLFVSHNMQSILNLCNRGILLKHGSIEANGNISSVIAKYNNDGKILSAFSVADDTKDIFISNVTFMDSNRNIVDQFETFDDVVISIKIYSKIFKDNIQVGYGFDNLNDVRLFTLYSRLKGKSYKIEPGENIIECNLSRIPLKPDDYSIKIFVGNDFETIEYYEDGVKLTILPSSKLNSDLPDKSHGHIIVDEQWF